MATQRFVEGHVEVVASRLSPVIMDKPGQHLTVVRSVQHPLHDNVIPLVECIPGSHVDQPNIGCSSQILFPKNSPANDVLPDDGDASTVAIADTLGRATFA
jgi:hypothetical protein